MNFDKELDARGLNCPLPILRAKKALAEMTGGQVLRILATDPGSDGVHTGSAATPSLNSSTVGSAASSWRWSELARAWIRAMNSFDSRSRRRASLPVRSARSRRV